MHFLIEFNFSIFSFIHFKIIFIILLYGFSVILFPCNKTTKMYCQTVLRKKNTFLIASFSKLIYGKKENVEVMKRDP